MNEYYQWQIAQLKATIAKQEQIIQAYAKRELARAQKIMDFKKK